VSDYTVHLLIQKEIALVCFSLYEFEYLEVRLYPKFLVIEIIA
jgi:hypothetical protein